MHCPSIYPHWTAARKRRKRRGRKEMESFCAKASFSWCSIHTFPVAVCPFEKRNFLRGREGSSSQLHWFEFVRCSTEERDLSPSMVERSAPKWVTSSCVLYLHRSCVHALNTTTSERGLLPHRIVLVTTILQPFSAHRYDRVSR